MTKSATEPAASKSQRRPRRPRRKIGDPPGLGPSLLPAAEQAYGSGQLGRATELYTQILDSAPNHREALIGLGKCFSRASDHERALEYFERVLDQAPRDPEALKGATISLLGSGHHERAMTYATRLEASEDPSAQVAAKDLLAQVSYDQADFLTADLKLTEAFAILDDHPQAVLDRSARHMHHLAAQVARELNRPHDAISHLRQLQSRKHWSRAIEDQLGYAYLEADRPEDAVKTFERILERHPDDMRALVDLGQAHLRRNDADRATEAFQRALSVRGDDLRALDGMAEAARLQGDLDAAARCIDQLSQRYEMPEAQRERRLRALDRERARREAELVRVRNIASLNLMATGIAHELRQPLSVIRLAAQNARADAQSGDTTRLVGDLDDIDANVEKVDKIIRTLRHIASETGGEPRPVDLATIVDRALVLFRTQLRNRGIELVLDNLDHMVIADEAGLEQMLVGMVSNARDALVGTDRGSLRISAVTGADSNRVTLYVRDNGHGMTETVRQQAFDPFFTTKEGHGTGLGLYIAHNLARKMGARLTLKRTGLGEGTEFELVLRKPE